MTFSTSLRLLILSTLFLFPGWAMAESSPKPGIYIAEEGRGILEIKPGKEGKMPFSVYTITVADHTCSPEGIIQGSTATLETDWDDDDKTCTVTFHQDGGTITVETSYSCRYFCGARASFDWEYLTPAPGCAPVPLRKTRDTFKKLYDRKDYAKARATLEPILKQCKETLRKLEEEDPIRNDLAVTYHKLGDYAACRKILAPYVEDAAKKDEDIEGDENYGMDSQAIYRSIVAAARVNLALCGKVGKISGKSDDQ